MPIVSRSTYVAPRWLRHGHAQTIFPALFRRGPQIGYVRQRIDTPDGDFLDIDWSCIDANCAVLIVHGLESSAREAGVRAMAAALNRRGWDAAALNLRGCSGVPNRSVRFYHAGGTDDVTTAIQAVLRSGRYRQIGLIGLSLGGNLILKYLGERGTSVPAPLCRAAAVSVPCDLASCVQRIMAPANRIYMHRMIWLLKKKVRKMRTGRVGAVQGSSLRHIKTIADFDQCYTAPLNGFADARDYWSRSSCRPWLREIRTPTLLINAQDDPLLTDACFPFEEARVSEHLMLEVPQWGGHVGFVRFRTGGEYWHEARVGSFITDTETAVS